MVSVGLHLKNVGYICNSRKEKKRKIESLIFFLKAQNVKFINNASLLIVKLKFEVARKVIQILFGLHSALKDENKYALLFTKNVYNIFFSVMASCHIINKAPTFQMFTLSFSLFITISLSCTENLYKIILYSYFIKKVNFDNN